MPKEPYRTLFPQVGKNLPVTERFLERVLTLPTGSSVTKEQIAGICDIVRFIVEHHEEVGQALKHRGAMVPATE